MDVKYKEERIINAPADMVSKGQNSKLEILRKNIGGSKKFITITLTP